ncbi:hypothetical protein BSKO_12638 [Bryopsis sp. KO-2023]|nr:hypothetical protein BSKO_12638 [Bryopsis sp. KO-2023]
MEAPSVRSNISIFARPPRFLEHKIFNSYHIEDEMLRYVKKLKNRVLSLCNSMIPLITDTGAVIQFPKCKNRRTDNLFCDLTLSPLKNMLNHLTCSMVDGQGG